MRQVLVVADHACVETVGVEVAAAEVTAVERLRVPERERVHPARHALQLAEHDEVKMVPHEAEGEQPPVRLHRREAKEAKEAVAVVVVHEDVAAVDAAHRQVVCAAVGKVVAAQSSHRSTVAARRTERIGAIGRVTTRHVLGTVPTKCGTAARFLGDCPRGMARTAPSLAAVHAVA